MLNTFERKILRRIYGRTQEGACWHPGWNGELYSLHSELYSLHSELYSLHSELYSLHSELYSLHSELYSLHSELYSLHSELYSLHLNCTVYTRSQTSWRTLELED